MKLIERFKERFGIGETWADYNYRLLTEKIERGEGTDYEKELLVAWKRQRS